MNAKKPLPAGSDLIPSVESDSSSATAAQHGDALFQNQIEPSDRQSKRRPSPVAVLKTEDLQHLTWLNTQQAALYMNTSPAGIRNRVYRGELKPRKPYGKRGKSYFSRRELDQLMGGLR